jgi:TonB family protein
VQIIFLSLVAVCVGLGTHQGVLLSQALNQVAGSVRLQASDVEWKTWNLSREVWAAGMQGYAERVRADRSIDLAVAAPLEQAAAAIETSFATAPVVMQVSTLEVPIPAGEQTAPTAVAETHKPVVTAPTLLSTSVPKYPWRARTRGIEGFVELAFSLDRKGNVVDVEVVDSLPEGIFDRAATKALKQWKFDALSASRKPQRLVQKFDFNLEQREQPERLARNCTATGRRSCRGFPSNAVVVYVNPPRGNETLSRVN